MTDGIRAILDAAAWVAGAVIGLTLLAIVIIVAIGTIALALEAIVVAGHALQPLRWRLRAHRTARRLRQGTRQ